MQIYLPIAEMPVNVFLILVMGLAVGFISGMFGIGGGFLMTPLLIFVGISPAVAVASVASHIAASSFTGALTYWRRRALDPALALMLLTGGLLGTARGGLAVRGAAARSASSISPSALLRDPARHRRRPDGRRERAGDRPRAPGQADRNPPRRQPYLDPRPAVQAPVQAVEDLRLHHPGVGHRLLHRLHRRRHGHRRRLSAGADADLFPARPDRRGDRHLDGADPGHHGDSRP